MVGGLLSYVPMTCDSALFHLLMSFDHISDYGGQVEPASVTALYHTVHFKKGIRAGYDIYSTQHKDRPFAFLKICHGNYNVRDRREFVRNQPGLKILLPF